LDVSDDLCKGVLLFLDHGETVHDFADVQVGEVEKFHKQLFLCLYGGYSSEYPVM